VTPRCSPAHRAVGVASGLNFERQVRRRFDPSSEDPSILFVHPSSLSYTGFAPGTPLSTTNDCRVTKGAPGLSTYSTTW
jgi:hypothetical protein